MRFLTRYAHYNHNNNTPSVRFGDLVSRRKEMANQTRGGEPLP